MKQPCVTKLIASLPQELSCFADRTNTGKLYTPFARRINSSADVTGTWENDHQKKEISKQNGNITSQNQRALHLARWGASSDQVRWAAQGCDPLRAKSSIQESGGQEPSDGGGVERAMWGAASLNLSALWGCAHATGRWQEAHAASELWRGCLPLPAPLNPRCTLLPPLPRWWEGSGPPVEDAVEIQPTCTKPVDAKATSETVPLQERWQGSFSWEENWVFLEKY